MKIYSNWADGAYDASFKRNGVTYYIQMEQGDYGNVVATWWDSSDNGLGYNNRGFIMLDLPFGMHKSDITPDNVIQYLGVNSSFDRRPNKQIADMLKKKAASLYVGVNSSKRSSGKYVNANTNKRSAKKKIMAGPGSSITIKLRDIKFTEVPSGGFYQEYNDYHNFLEPENGWCKGTIDIKSIGTYYDGGDPELGDIPVNIQVYEVRPDTYEEGEDMIGLSLKEVIDDIDDIEDTIHIGGGWVTITFDGKFDVTAYTYHSTVLLKVEIPDKELVDWLNRWAHGETVEMYYEICINGDYQGTFIEDLDDAIETAKQYAADPKYADDEITVVIEHYRVNYYGDIEDYYDDDGDVVWNSNDELYE